MFPAIGRPTLCLSHVSDKETKRHQNLSTGFVVFRLIKADFPLRKISHQAGKVLISPTPT